MRYVNKVLNVCLSAEMKGHLMIIFAIVDMRLPYLKLMHLQLSRSRMRAFLVLIGQPMQQTLQIVKDTTIDWLIVDHYAPIIAGS